MKEIKFIQVNIYKGRYLNSLVEFLINEHPDFISMQEVTTNRFNLCPNKQVSVFEILKDKLGMHGLFNSDLRLKKDESSVFGNALFSRFEIVKTRIEILKTFRPVTLKELDGNDNNIREQLDRHLLDASVDFFGNNIHILSWHGAWTAPPTDTDETLKQSKKAADYLKSLKEPFILGGDLNNTINSKTVGLVNRVCKNLMFSCDARQTTQPTIHKIAPRGLLIDYIFTSEDFKLNSIKVPNVTVSDHLPVIAKLEIR